MQVKIFNFNSNEFHAFKYLNHVGFSNATNTSMPHLSYCTLACIFVSLQGDSGEKFDIILSYSTSKHTYYITTNSSN